MKASAFQTETYSNLSPAARRLFNDLNRFDTYYGSLSTEDARNELASKSLATREYGYSKALEGICRLTKKGLRVARAI